MAIVKWSSLGGERNLTDALGVIQTALRVAEATKAPVISDVIGSLLGIVDIVQEIRTDKATCVRLVQRAGDILLNVHNSFSACQASFHKSPGQLSESEALLRQEIHRFSSIVEDIQAAFQKHSSRGLWKRIWRKHSISEDIADLSVKLDQAQADFIQSLQIFNSTASVALMAESLSQPENSIDDDEGVALEYKDIKIGRDVLPYQSSPGCFWSNFAEAILRSSSQKVLIKRYHGSDESKTTQAFLRDLKALKYARHGSLPELYGFSAHKRRVPFIAITMKEITPLGRYLETSKKNSNEIWHMLIDMFNATQFLLEKSPDLCQHVMEDIIRDSIVDETGTIVLAPSAESDPDFKARPISRVKTIHILNQDNTFTCEDFDSPADVCAYLICWRWHQLLKHVRDYRSLGYVLENKAHRMDFLKSSRHDIDNPKRSSYLLSKWRVGPAERQVQWGFGPIVIHPLVDSVAVGDIGHFTPNPEGEVRFQVLFNVAQELGGAKIYNVSKLGGQVMEDDGVRYVRYFPLDQHGEARNIRYSHTASLVDSNLAWSYLARHAFSISARFGLQCEDLVLVTTTFLQLNVTNRPHPNRTYTSFEKLRQAKRMPTFDCVIGPQGQLRGCHWSFEDDPRVEPNKQSKDEIKALDIPETVISSRLGAFVQLESGDAYEDRPACKL